MDSAGLNLTQSPSEPPGQDDRRPGKRPAARGTAFYPRKRANTACQVCRARKTKCDNRKPSCSYCLSVGATCIQSPVDLSSFDPASLKILERLDELEGLLRETRGGLAPDASSYDEAILPTQSPELSRNIGSMPGLETAGVQDVSLRSILPEKAESLLLWPVFQNQSLHTSSVSSPFLPLQHPSPSSLALDLLLDGEAQGINALLDRFFTHVHCKNPILQEAPTRRLVANMVFDGADWSPQSCLALVICALGKLATPFNSREDTKPGSAAYRDAQVYFHAAQKRLGLLLCQTDIASAQCLFLSGVYMMCIHQPVYAWRFFSQSLAMCQHLPFLRQAQNTMTLVPGMSPGATDTRDGGTLQQAMYWSAWKSEIELRGELTLPDFPMPPTTSALYPSFFPTPPHPAESMRSSDFQRQRRSWLFYLAEISLRRLASRVCGEIMELHMNASSNLAFLNELAPVIPEYESQFQQWRDSLPAEFSMDAPPENDDVCLFVLRGHTENFYEAIYWPFLMAYLGLQEARLLNHSVLITLGKRALEVHVRRVQVNEPGFTYRHHGTWLMLRSCTRSALVLLGAKTLGCEVPDGWRRAVEGVLYLISAWEDEIQELPELKLFMERALETASQIV